MRAGHPYFTLRRSLFALASKLAPEYRNNLVLEPLALTAAHIHTPTVQYERALGFCVEVRGLNEHITHLDALCVDHRRRARRGMQKGVLARYKHRYCRWEKS